MWTRPSFLALAASLGVACGARCGAEPPAPSSSEAATPSNDHDAYADARDTMVDAQIAARGVRTPRVLEAMRRVPRHRFVPHEMVPHAYEDRPLAIGHDQTISQPYIVATMSELAEIEPGDRVLEIGTGAGYQAAVLTEMGADVYTIEIVEALGREAAERLAALGYQVRARIGDGYRGWPEAAPFDAILVTAAPPEIPRPLEEQLAVGGCLVAPVGRASQELVVLRRTPHGIERRSILPVRFVPMTGEAQAP
jgi:protein-L-isoaspartate(D-aspartate) O-methyltransferase